MKKLFLIGLKDLKITFRDKTALIMMLLAPFLLTVGMGFITGRFSNTSNLGISNIPVILVNQDDGELGKSLLEVFQSANMNELLTPSLEMDPLTARQMIDDDQAAAAVIIPSGFSDTIFDPNKASDQSTKQIEIYVNPTRLTTAGVVKAIVDEFISRVEVGRVGAQVVVTQLISNGLIQPQEAIPFGMEVGQKLAEQAQSDAPLSLKSISNTGAQVDFDIMAYMAPGMALLFLMFTVTNGGRVLLSEKFQGTLPRLMISPTTSTQILGGKIFGIFLTGVAQMLILIITSALFFQLKWGDPLGVFFLVIAAVIGAVGWGLLLTALVKTPGQVTAFGTALMLLFSILGGSFIDREMLPGWIKTLSLVTPNAWGMDGFTTLALGGGLSDILTPILGLLIMGTLLFILSVILFNRRGFTKG